MEDIATTMSSVRKKNSLRAVAGCTAATLLTQRLPAETVASGGVIKTPDFVSARTRKR
jgi:hypothetical protein